MIKTMKLLSQWKIEYARDLAVALNNKKILDNLRDGLPYPYIENDAKEFITAMQNADKNKVFAFAIVLENKCIGSIGVFRQGNIHSRTAELGYYIAEEYWGKGIMTRAVNEICDYVFENTDIVRIFAEPFVHNFASQRVLENNGFSCEGILKNNAYKNGRLVDMKMYAKLKCK